jgi:predicted outer membrane repeat protein
MRPPVLCASALALLVSLTATTSSTTIIVDVEGGGDYLTIGDAIVAAADGDTIEIAPGTYLGPDNRGLDPTGKTLVIVGRGGPDATTIDCEGADRAFVLQGAEGPGFVFEGLTMRHGEHTRGGAVQLDGTSPTFRSCVFTENAVTELGGAVRCIDSEAQFEDCVFSANLAEDRGGAFYIQGSSHVTMTGIVFEGNHCEASGGAIHTTPGSWTTLTGVTFYDNTSGGSGAAVAYGGAGTHMLTEALLARNTTLGTSGGALAAFANTDVLVDGCTFVLNGASGTTDIRSAGYDATLTVTRSVLAFGVGARAVACEATHSQVTFTHCCVFGNAGTDSLCGTYYENLFAIPGFCDVDADDYTLHDISPCLPANNPWGELIGAYGQGCVYPGPLDPPDGVWATADDRTAFVGWRAVTDPDLYWYRIERDTTAAFGTGTAEFVTPDTLVVDTPLENWREYFYRVFAVDGAGGESDPSETLSILVHPTPPSAPTGFAAVGIDQAADLLWDRNPESDVHHYAVYRDTQSGFIPGDIHATTLAPTFRDTGLTNYVDYYYRVAAIDTGGLVGDPCGEARAVPHGIPPPLTGLRAVPGDSGAFLDWDAAVPACQDFYRVYRDTSPDMHSTTLFADDFEPYEAGQPPPDPPWNLVEQGGTSVRVTETFAGEGARCLALADSAFAHLRLFHTLDDTTGDRIAMDFLCRPGPVAPETNLLQCEVFGERGMGYQASLLEIRDGVLAHWVGGSGTVTIAPIAPGEWHEIGWRLDCAADTYGVWLDGEHVVQGAPFYNKARYLDILQLRTRSPEWSRNWVDAVLWREHVGAIASTPENQYADQPLQSGRTYYYQVSVVDTFGVEGHLGEIVQVTPGWVGVDEGLATTGLVASFSPNVPNPFGSQTALSYTVPEPGARVTIAIYDVGGRLVRTLIDREDAAGTYHLVWGGRSPDGRAVASGVYFCRVSIGNWSETRKMVIVR